MATVETVSGVPCRIEAGTTVRFTLSNSNYSAEDWTLSFVLNNGADDVISIEAEQVGDTAEYLVEIPATTALKPGVYQWAEYFSSGTERGRGCDGKLTVTANLAQPATPSHAQRMVTLLEGALAKLAASPRSSVSFEGQSFTRESMATYTDQLTYWKSRVIAEDNANAIARGEHRNGAIGITFGCIPNNYCR